MDEIAQYNIKRWKALAEANALFTRPFFDLTAAEAAERLDPEGRLDDLAGKNVLCLAGGGGRQSAMFALLGAQVTVLDLSQEQLQRDREVARHYSFPIETVQGDMRDLSCFQEAAFDIVWHPYSINFIPDVQVVFRQVARILRRDGLYYLLRTMKKSMFLLTWTCDQGTPSQMLCTEEALKKGSFERILQA